MIEILTFFGAVGQNKWIPKLWGKLKRIRQEREKELDEINNIMFGDPLDLAKYYVEPDCQESNPANRRAEDEMVAKQPVMTLINTFFKQTANRLGNNQLFVLSDAGMGKSALLTMLKLMHLTQFWTQDRNCVLKKIGYETIDDIKNIRNKRKTILLLDSLDEDPKAYGRVKDRLIDILDASQNFAKVIITCRTQFFPESEKDPLECPGQVVIEPFTCYSKYLSFFNNKKVYQYLSKRFPKKFLGLWTDQDKIKEAKKIIKMMGSLRCRPMLLSYVEDLMNSQLMKKGGNEFQIYDALIDTWLMRELPKIMMQDISGKDISRKDFYDACIILAVEMQIRQTREISEDALDKLIGEIVRVKPIKKIEMKGRSLLNLNSDGDYRFSHYSIQEFCVAKFLSEKSLFKPKAKFPVTNEILQMIAMSEKINPESAKLIQIGQSEVAQKIITKFGMEFVYVPPGILRMGKQDSSSEEIEFHMVLLTNGFYLQTAPVTQTQWEAVMGNNPSEFKGNADRPVENISWDDTQGFIKKLNEIEGTDKYRLPTEAEWEYACRAGTTSDFSFGDDESKLGEYAWYRDNSENKTHPVGQKKSNAWGIYDMHGNVWEWVGDDWHEDYNGAPDDGCAWIDIPRGANRVFRGGSWRSDARYCRAADRSFNSPGYCSYDVGFRLFRFFALGP